ncbi:MAG: hypothetical protein JXR64_13225 [Spirochaetales bacterium]|nr:hypothetical protein [Spirochaetales bacterium]
MIGFIIKKAFFDTWDNLIKFVVLNLMTIPFLFIIYLGLNFISSGNLLGVLLIAIGLILFILHLGTIAYLIRDIGNSSFGSMKDYIKYFKEEFNIKIKFGVSWTLFIILTTFSIGYYLNGEGFLSLIPLALVFWFSMTTSLAVILFFPIKTRFSGNFIKIVKKSFIILLDNSGVGIFVFIYTIILLILSIPTLGLLFPGVSSIMCVLDTTVHMYELKYDYLEANPEADRKKLPWNELYYELNENIGPRSLKGMIFPWKD